MTVLSLLAVAVSARYLGLTRTPTTSGSGTSSCGGSPGSASELGRYGALEIDIPFEVAYAARAWLCWVPNLLVAWLLTRTDQLGWVRAAERP
ncbi:hypothetical protein [Actinokineospora xionganensis]|uniref:Uncharacterized protein n=1 Tax=Actinokineospora xionganensis TaxID=2684470 RepID=A0ABR7L8R2_9PSEU|nr:hypothetical protein [Actinokineospora xionganensis]MBC6449083.1 hypothetical protein [Actinokineospora xionganensis]